MANVNLDIDKQNNPPRVLLLCSFSQNSANGITIANLFNEWPNDRIAVAEFKDGIGDIYVNGISKYYLLGNREMRFLRPFNLLRRVRGSEALVMDTRPTDSTALQRTTCKKSLVPRIKTIALKLQRKFLHVTGLVLVSRKFTVSEQFDQWLREFSPDIIYATAGDICTLDFIFDLKVRYGYRLAIHVFDDFVNSKYQYTASPKYWRRRLDKAFRQVVEGADLHLSISEKMAFEYGAKYGRTFYSFHNPINPRIWLTNISEKNKPPVEKSLKSISPEHEMGNAELGLPFTFVYAGKVNRDTVVPLCAFIEACNKLTQAGHNVRLHIYSPYSSTEVRMKLGDKMEGVFQGRAKYTDLPNIFRAADGLLLPLDFSDETIRYIRLSMLTKATEYMISGTPIFLFAPKGIAVSEYLLCHDCAYHAPSMEQMEEHILNFIADGVMRGRVTKNAFNLAKSHHLQETVGRNLRECIGSVCRK